jgi:hemerythrin-like metal-binding protein
MTVATERTTPRATCDAGVELHHRVQLGLVKVLEVQLERDPRGPEARETLRRLLDFTRVHFHAEELLMHVHGYPDVNEHAAAHALLLAESVEIAHAHEAGEGRAARETLARLRAWIVDHVRGMDQAFEDWCARTGIRLD